MLDLRKINKEIEPTTLTHYRSSIAKENLEDSNVYNDFPNKTKKGCKENEPGNLRKQLLEEQGYICCYCMSRIDCINSKIEHFKDQAANRDLQINYQNLFIACNGNEGFPLKQQHCDSFKGAGECRHINLLSYIENDIKYQSSDGKIFSTNKEINQEIEDVLNLNAILLKNNRKQALGEFLIALKKRFGTGKWRKGELKNEIERYEKKNEDNKFKQFNAMFVYFLNKKLQKL